MQIAWIEINIAEQSLKDWYSPQQIMRDTYVLTRIYWWYYTAWAMIRQTKLKRWEMLYLKPDSENDSDCFAIKVCNKKGECLGFLKKELSTGIINIGDYECRAVDTISEEDLVWTTKFMRILLTNFWL